MLHNLAMAEVKPFRGIVYSGADISKVVAPPYDVINEKMQEKLYQASPYNIVRLTLGKIFPDDDERNNRYTRAAEFLRSWLESGILRELEEELFYLYEQEFEVEGSRFVRKALVARVRLEDFDKKIIIPHEKTLSAPKEDRYKLLTYTKANLSPVFGIVLEDGEIYETLSRLKAKLLFSFTDENSVVHRFFLIDRAQNRQIEKLFENKQILIADGHHRYETALRYRNEMMKRPDYREDADYNYVMMAIVSSQDKGLVVFPIHRVIKNVEDSVIEKAKEKLKRNFVKEIKDPKKTNAVLKQLGKAHFAFIDKTEAFVFRLEKQSGRLDVEILTSEVIKGLLGITDREISEKSKIEYFKNIDEALGFLREKGKAILSYNPPSVDEIARVSLSGLTMPQKSTYFFPKFYSGFVIYKFRE